MSDLCHFLFIVVFFNPPYQRALCAWVNGKTFLYSCHYNIFVNLRMELLVCVLVLAHYVHFSAFLFGFFPLQYDIVGHSGDGFDIELVRCEKVPKNNKQRLQVLKVCNLRKYYVHSFMLCPFVWRRAS